MKKFISLLTIILAFCACPQNAMSADAVSKYSQFLSCFSDSTYYAIENIAGHEVLFVSNEVFLNAIGQEPTHEAIAAQLYMLDDSGKITCLGEARSQGTLYPLALSNGTLLTAGHHSVTRYTVDGQPASLSLTESADETFNKKGKATYSYENRVTNEFSNPKDNQKLAALFTEIEKAQPIVFTHYVPADNTSDIRNTFVHPLATSMDISNIKDATLAAAFTTKDFNWKSKKLALTFYEQQLYDTIDLHQLQIGDSIFYSGDTILVSKKEEKNGEVIINDGYDHDGITLWPYEGGTYRAVQYDDHSVYAEIGKTQFAFSDNFTIVDCKDDPQAPSTTIRKNQKLYLDKLKGGRNKFSCLDTTVQIENGKIVNITRRWIP